MIIFLYGDNWKRFFIRPNITCYKSDGTEIIYYFKVYTDCLLLVTLSLFEAIRACFRLALIFPII